MMPKTRVSKLFLEFTANERRCVRVTAKTGPNQKYLEEELS